MEDSTVLRYKLHDSWEDILFREWPDMEEYEKASTGKKMFFGFLVPLSAEHGMGIDRHKVLLARTDGKGTPVTMEVPSLRELFRGNINPGDFGKGMPPVKYQQLILQFETKWVNLVDGEVLHAPRDQDMYEFYSNLRRRPDGRSLGLMHDILWQIWVFLAATFVVSEAEFGSCLSRLQRSASTFKTSVSSANMYANLSGVFDGSLGADTL